MAVSKNTEKYSSLLSTYMFEPITVENLGTLSSSTLDSLVELGRRISSQSGNVRESSYLLQRISVAVQRFNSVLLHDSLTADIPDLYSIFMAALAALWNRAGHYTFCPVVSSSSFFFHSFKQLVRTTVAISYNNESSKNKK